MKSIKLLSTTALILLTSAVLAGEIESVRVEVILNEDGSGVARGDMWTARDTKNDIELIGCGIKSLPGGLHFGFCQATQDDGSETGLYAVCFTEDTELLDALKAIGDYSFIRFDWDTDGTCTRIDVSTQSFYLPRVETQGKK
jgi:hypothetical protein